MRADHYDGFAAAYDRENSASLLNAYYNRPALISLAGDVRGRRILDAGCGSGPLTLDLRAGGAIMSGFDGSPAMVEIARERLGDDVTLVVADLAGPLPFDDVFTHPDEDYFATRQYSDEFEFDGQPGILTFWHRPLHAMTDAFTAAGFDVAVVAEPPPAPDTPEELLTPRIRRGETTGFLAFLFFVLTAR